ncbi:MAG: porin [Marinibacterium sp.]
MRFPARIARIVLTAGACLAWLSAPARAGPTFDGPGGMTFDYYGHLNGAVAAVDDGVETSANFADSAHSTSRFGFNIRRPVGASEFRFHFETALGFPSIALYDNDPTTPDPTFDWTQEDLRKVEISLGNPSWGRIWAGQGSMASDGAAEVDLSGTGLTNYVAVQDTAGLFQFRSGAVLSGITIANVFNQFDGNGRRGRVRYDSPSFARFVLSASAGRTILRRRVDSDSWDVALSYANTFDTGTRVSAKLAWFQQDNAGTLIDGVTGSASVLFRSGVNVTFASGSRGRPSYVYGKIGLKRTIWDIGPTAMAVDYYRGSDFGLSGAATQSSSDAWGIGAVQTFADLNLEAYLGYRRYGFDDDVADYSDLSSVILGARWKF